MDMWKIPFTLFIILSGVISGLLFWQWHAYSKEMEKPVDIELASQQVSIKTESNSLLIIQKLSGLTGKKEYTFSLPSGVKEWQCIQEDGKDCEQQDESLTTLKADAKGSLHIQYYLPVNTNERAFLYNDWLASFSNVQVSDTKVELIDSSNRNGTWVMGIPLIGNKKLDFIDYYVFEGELAHPSLYWQANSLRLDEVDHKLVVYSEQQGSVTPTFKAWQELSDRPQVTVVKTNQLQEGNGNGMIITRPDVEPELLERKLIYSFIKSRFDQLPIEQSWLVDLHVSLYLNIESQIPKSNQMIQELRSKLSEEEIKNYLEIFLTEDTHFKSNQLDDILKTVKGKKTSFFDLNKNEEVSIIPLYYVDERNVSVMGNVQENLHIVYMEDRILFPFVETLAALGFQVKALPNNETLLLTKGLNSYRFYVNQNIFIYNEEDYGLLENPLTKINHTIYMDYQWLTSLFQIEIDEDENTVYVKYSTE
jgi:hypothetical protein